MEEPKSRNEKLLSDIYDEMSRFGVSEIEIDENTSRNETLLTKIYETLKQITPSGSENYSKDEIDEKIQAVRDLIEADYATKIELSDKLDTSTASETYATKTDLNSKLDSETASETYATKADLNSKLDTETASETYATKTDLNSKLDSETASDTYTTKVELTQFKNTLSASVTSMEKRITALEGVTFHKATKNNAIVNEAGMLILQNNLPSNQVLLTARWINPDTDNTKSEFYNFVPIYDILQ